VGIELVGPDGRTPAPQAASQALELARRAGVLVGKGGLHGNCLRVAPPLSITAEEVDTGAAVLLDVIDRVDREQVGR